MTRRLVFSLALLISGCQSQQAFTLGDRSTADAVLASSRIVVDGHITMNASRGREHWYQTVFPFLPITTSDPALGAVHDVDITVDRVVKGGESATTLRIHNHRDLTTDEIAQLPYPHDVMAILGGGLCVRLGYDRRSGTRFTNLHIVAIENTHELTEALRHATTRPASRATR